MINFINFFNILQENKQKKIYKGKNLFGNLKEMNITSIEKKNIAKTDKKLNVMETNKMKNTKNINIKKIEPKKLGMKNLMGSINPMMKNNRIQSNTISLAEKLSDISEKLEKYENLINKFGKEFE